MQSPSDTSSATARYLKRNITPCLWFDTHVEEAVRFYTSLFPRSSIGEITRFGKEGFEIHGRPEGSIMTVSFEISGYGCVALNGGPGINFTPAISLFVACGSEAEVDALWKQLVDGGMVIMELGVYEWSDKYGWLNDRYGLSWQIFLGDPDDVGQTISPSLFFVGEQAGKAEEAIHFYTTLFRDSSVTGILRYGADEAQGKESMVKHAQFTLSGEVFMAMDSPIEHDFTFSEAFSFIIECASEAEIDHFWRKLADGGQEGPCGWIKDKFGVSWQVVPSVLYDMLRSRNEDSVARVTRAMLQMQKLDIRALTDAFESDVQRNT